MHSYVDVIVIGAQLIHFHLLSFLGFFLHEILIQASLNSYEGIVIHFDNVIHFVD